MKFVKVLTIWDTVSCIKNSSSYFEEDKYFISADQIFLYKRNSKWHAPKGYCFVKPIQSNNKFSTEHERPLIGVIKYVDKDLLKNGINTLANIFNFLS